MPDLSGQEAPSETRRVLVTGAAAGIGRAAALRLAADGAAVALVDICEGELATVAAEAHARGIDVLEFVADVADEAAMESVFKAVGDTWGGLDAAVAAAGISMSTTGDARVDRLELSIWERIIRTNLTGMFITCKHATRLVAASGGGSIVIVGSPTGMYGFAYGEHAYSASKGGCHALARNMAGELASLGIRVNVVVPGFVDTAMNAHVVADAQLLADAEKLIPLGRIGKPAEVAGLIAWLVSADASYATGGYFMVDGGQTCL
jgi:NAD(P)-dependent dehydrogenase (short-subunit alcohol dehydrogenase family)